MAPSTTARIRLAAVPAFFLGVLVALGGCSAASGAGGGGGAATRSSTNLITRAEILEVPDGSAYTIVQQLRPRWLRTRTPGTFSSPEPILPEVFVDEQRYGPIEALYSIGSTNIQEMEFINARDATTLWGTGYMGGVIHVHTRR